MTPDEEYRNAANDAARRNRTTVIVLVVACVLGFVGVLNTLPSSWMIQRLASIGKDDAYAAARLGYLDEADRKMDPQAVRNKIRENVRAKMSGPIKTSVGAPGQSADE